MPTTKTTSLYAKLAKVLAEVGTVAKKGHNDFHNYDYVTESDLTERIRPLLAKEGVGIVFAADEFQELSEGRMAVRVVIHIGDSDGNEIVAPVWGLGQDISRSGKVGDKAIQKAMTNAVKYWLYKTFLVSTGDESERDTRQDEINAADRSSPQPQFGSKATSTFKQGYPTSAQRVKIEALMSVEGIGSDAIEIAKKVLKHGATEGQVKRIIQGLEERVEKLKSYNQDEKASDSFGSDKKVGNQDGLEMTDDDIPF